MLFPLVMFDPNKVERTVVVWMSLAALVGLVAFWRSRRNEKVHQLTILSVWGLQWIWLLGLLYTTYDFPWVYATEPTWLDDPIQVTYIHPSIRYSFNLFIIFPFLKFATDKILVNKWVDRLLWFLPILIYLVFLIGLLFADRPYFMG